MRKLWGEVQNPLWIEIWLMGPLASEALATCLECIGGIILGDHVCSWHLGPSMCIRYVPGQGVLLLLCSG